MKIVLSLLYIVISIIGIADAGYITYTEYLDPTGTVACGPGFDCGTVLHSDFAYIGPVPLSVLGLLFYLTVFALAILHYLDIEITPYVNKIADKLNLAKTNPLRFITTIESLQITTVFGALFSLYLLSIMGLVLQAWCQFCLISAGTSLSLFLVTVLYTHYVKPQPPFVLKFFHLTVFRWLYTNFLKPVLFLFDAERVHNSFLRFGSLLGSNRVTQQLTHASFAFNHPATSTTHDGISFPNPVGLAAGFDYNGQLTGILPDVGFGWHTIGTVTFQSYQGNPKPRLGRLPASKALLVNKGLKSLGAKAVIGHLKNKNFRIPTGISIASTNKKFSSTKAQIADILMTFQLFEAASVNHSYYELNISCPNTFGGQPFTKPSRLKLLLTALEKLSISRPIYLKMPIDQSEDDTRAILDVIEQYSIAGVIFGNLTKDKNNPAIKKTDRKTWQNLQGNVSGKPTWERSNNLIALTREEYGNRFTIIGTGGIFTPQDAQEKLKAGADLVQLITGVVFEGPQAIGAINHYLSRTKLTKPASAR